ncbi:MULTISPECIES: hypothetical protein [Kordiimonas]|jgi:hypothetical protein|uniref:Uncharacterized protein n=1 Tax=Kordiimonas lacus TaxID=637679 RepID=A0A1G7ACG9_9PROT|nr:MULTISPECIES: hypothetical protein [Kordiimonas]SDE11715.1 hypothetical protein SAMN04488071_2153 [Kordiimonas lacus]
MNDRSQQHDSNKKTDPPKLDADEARQAEIVLDSRRKRKWAIRLILALFALYVLYFLATA